ncbi:hypothetical protein [Isoptericola jiangsuensis]|nr:hypothetical protein [Isoptericola jiangsuensis]
MDTTFPPRPEVADLDEVVDELIAYDAAILREAAPVTTVHAPSTPGMPTEFTD